jgi:hypothetical protein
VVLCELVRVDLEYRWQRGQPNALSHYGQLFPELFRDRRKAREVLYEELRLRVQAGESVSPADYRAFDG